MSRLVSLESALHRNVCLRLREHSKSQVYSPKIPM